MALKLKADALTEGLPSIALAGKDYFVAPLFFRQTIANAVLYKRVNAVMQRFVALGAAVNGGGVEPDFDETEFIALTDFVVNALKRLYPEATRDDLLDSEVTAMEMLKAVPVIMSQSGGKKRDADAGELPATSLSTNSTGSGSSPSS